MCEGLGAIISSEDTGLTGSDRVKSVSAGCVDSSSVGADTMIVGERGSTADTPSARSIPSLSEHTDGDDGVSKSLGSSEGGGVIGTMVLAESCCPQDTGLVYAEHEYGSIGECRSVRPIPRGVSGVVGLLETFIVCSK